MGRCSIVAICASVLCVSETYVVASGPSTYDFAFSLSLDVGHASMDTFGHGVDDFATELSRINPEIELAGKPGGNRLFTVSPRFRLFLPHSTFVETGVEYLRNTGALHVNIGDLPAEFSYTNFSVAVPVLFGGRLGQVLDIEVWAALGPSLLFYNRSNWSYDQGQTSDFGSSRGGGFEVEMGAEYPVLSHLSASLSLRYRYLHSNELRLVGQRYPPVPSLVELDYSGLSVSLGVRWHSF